MSLIDTIPDTCSTNIPNTVHPFNDHNNNDDSLSQMLFDDDDDPNSNVDNLTDHTSLHHNNAINDINNNVINDLNNRVSTIEKSIVEMNDNLNKSVSTMNANIQSMLQFMSKSNPSFNADKNIKNNSKREMDDDTIADTVIMDLKQTEINNESSPEDNEDDDIINHNHNRKHNHHHNNNHNHNKHNNDINANNSINNNIDDNKEESLINFISKAKQLICINFIDFQDKDIYKNKFNIDSIIAAKRKTQYEIENNITTDNNYKQPIPHQLLSQAISDDIYATDGVANNDINERNIMCERNRALSKLPITMNNWRSKIENANDDVISKLLNATRDPTENQHNKAEIDKINTGIAGLININKNDKISLNVHGINSIQLSEILPINNINLNELFNELYNILIYNEEADKQIQPPNNRIKNGSTVLYPNVPILNSSHINRINNIIGSPGNRLYLDPDSEETLQHFGQLLCISANPLNHTLHWDLINTPFKQMLTLQCIRNIFFNVNMVYNTHPDVINVKKSDTTSQLSQLSAEATKICKNRIIPQSKKDIYWVTNRKQWGLCGDIIADARKLHIAIGTLNKKLFKYGCGKRLLHRTNWDLQALSLVGDINQQRQKTLCSKINNLKRSYELQISECIIVTHFESVIALFNKLQNSLKYSNKLDTFCKTLANPNAVDFNENLVAMFKKAEIAIAGAFRSIAEFNLDTMKLTRDLLKWWTLLKYTPNKLQAKQLKQNLKSDIKTLNLIINGELRGSAQRREVLTNRLLQKYQNNTDITSINVKNKNTNNTINNTTNNNGINIVNDNTNNTRIDDTNNTRIDDTDNTINDNVNATNINNTNINNTNNGNKHGNKHDNKYKIKIRNKRRKLNNSSFISANNSINTNNSTLSLCDNLFDKANVFNTGNNSINNKRIQIIRDCLSTFQKEDRNINTSSHTSSINSSSINTNTNANLSQNLSQNSTEYSSSSNISYTTNSFTINQRSNRKRNYNQLNNNNNNYYSNGYINNKSHNNEHWNAYSHKNSNQNQYQNQYQTNNFHKSTPWKQRQN